MAVAQHFHFKLIANAQLVALVKQVSQPVAGEFHRHAPAGHPLFEQQAQGDGVVAVEGMTRDERQPAFSAHVHHAQIARFQQELAVFDVALQLAQFGRRLHQRERGEHHLFAAAGQAFRHIQPVAHFGGAALAAHRFAEVNHVGAAGRGLLVKIFQRLFWPVVEHRS